MRARLMLIVGLGLAGILVVTFISVRAVVGGVQEAQAQSVNLSCDAAIGPWNDNVFNGQSDAAKLDDEQRAVVQLIVSIGRQRNLAPLAWQVAIQAGMQESKLRNINYGDRDSLGIFQMRPSMGWGSVAEVTNPEYAVHKFYDVLVRVPGWDLQRPGDSAQDVERSGFPLAYHRWEAMAAFLLGSVGQIADPTGCGEGLGALLPPNQRAGQSITFALGEQGKPYVWGATGPSSYDCSGLMLRAFGSAGVKLPRTSREQYRAGAMLPVQDAQPGDLIFWAYDTSNPATIHHVALYLGNMQIVEAPTTGIPVRIRNIKWTDPELVPQAVRPGV